MGENDFDLSEKCEKGGGSSQGEKDVVHLNCVIIKR